MRVALGQFNPIMGNFNANIAKMQRFYADAKNAGADLLVFGELCLCGYPPEDLMHKPHFLEQNHTELENFVKICDSDMTVLVGFAEQFEDACYNSAAIIQNSEITGIYRKAMLPNYGVFDEKRYFSAGNEPVVIDIKGTPALVTICEDIWQTDWLESFVGKTKFDFIINLSGSPFHKGKITERFDIISNCARKFNVGVGYCNLVGGQDELVFDGQSMFVDKSGQMAAVAKAFEEGLLIADIEDEAIKSVSGQTDKLPEVIEEIWTALVVGTRDYVKKNGFEKVVIGLSGGIDSSIVATIAVEALGKENVIGITMPSKFNSSETISDAEKLAQNLDIQFYAIPIESILASFDNELKNIKGWDINGLAYENLQSRVRGNLLMSVSNQFGCMVLTTGNKSETAVGYSTLYGDTAGGFAVLKDVPKTVVYKLCEFINKLKGKETIPQSVITRPPSAELRADQLDTDSLPDYDTLDKILEGYVELDKSAAQLVDEGLPVDVVNRVIMLVDRNEYKRRQCPPGVKITPKAFGRDRRLPITNKYRTQAK